MRRVGYALVAVGVALIIAGQPSDAAPAERPSPPTRPESMIGVYVDAETNGDTRMFINCGGDNTLEGDEGDGTLFIANVEPGRYRCTITIEDSSV